MLELKFRRRDEYGTVVMSEDGIIDLMYSGEFDGLSDIEVEETTDTILHNKWANIYDEELLKIYKKPTQSVEENDRQLQDIWLIPQEYKELNIEKYLLNKCKTDIEKSRVTEELSLFHERKMEIILQTLIYLVDVMRKNNVVWGVGRGSACASYCLYLIGIHKIDSIKYNLDIKEFLK